jgi:thiol-disulfide isomerase/thioredoxin
MSEIIITVFVAVIFFFLGIVFCAFIRGQHSLKERQRRISYEIPMYINCAKDIRDSRKQETLSMIENKIYEDLSISMRVTKKGGKYESRLDFQKTTIPMVAAWQQSKEYFATYGMDTIRKHINIIPKDTEGWEFTTKIFELFQEKLKEVPLTFKGKYTEENALPAPEPEFDKWNDPPVTLEQLRGKVVLLNFWALGCLPCKQMMPQLEKLKEKYGEKGLEIISIAPPCKDGKQVIDFFSAKGYTFRKAIASSKTWTIYPIRGVPTNFLINKNGYLAQGPIHELPDTDIIEELLVIQCKPPVTPKL